MQRKTALILGASGHTGKHCLNILLNGPFYSKIIILVRRHLDIDDHRLQQRIIDFDLTGAMEKFYDDVDDVFCCIGTDLKNAGNASALRRVDFHIPTEAANIAFGHGVKQFLAVSTKGADNKSSDLYRRIKGEMEKGLEQFGFVALHIFRPSEAHHEDSKGYNKGGVLKRLFDSGGSSHRYKKPIGAETLAKAMVYAAQLGVEGNFYYNSSQVLELSDEKDLISQNYSSRFAQI